MTTHRITSGDPTTATGSNRTYFDSLQSTLGLIPNLARAMAQSPAVLESYILFKGALRKGSLGRRLGEELSLTLAGANHCDYCASAHSVPGKLAGLNEAEIRGALTGNAEDSKNAAALRFAQLLVENRGQITDTDFQAVRSAGFSEGEVGEIVAHVAVNVLTNYFNNVARTDIDSTLETTRWQYHHGVENAGERIAPEAIALDQALLDRPQSAEIQLDLIGDYKSNVVLYPRFQEFFRQHRLPTLAVWGKNDPFFLPAGAEAYRRDNPAAKVVLYDTGHLALETHVEEIAAEIRAFGHQIDHEALSAAEH